MISKAMLGCVFTFFFLCGVVCYAQGAPSADEIVSKMQSQLNLTPDEVAAVKPIIEQNAVKRQELKASMEGGSADKDSIHAQMKQLKEEEVQQLGQVLTPQQLSQWQSMRSQMHKGGRHKGGE